MKEIFTRIMLDIVKDFNTEKLIEYLRRRDLKFKKIYFKILCKEEIIDLIFFKLTKEDFCDIGFALSPVTVLAEFIKGLSQNLRNYSLLKILNDLKEMLYRNKINEKNITNIKQFTSDE